MITAPHRRHAGYLAFLLHRLSGLALALFLPLHFWVLGTALRGSDSLDGLLRWSELPLVKLAETVLVALLALHLAGGLRLLAMELLPWHDRQKNLIAGSFAVALAVAVLLLLNATAV